MLANKNISQFSNLLMNLYEFWKNYFNIVNNFHPCPGNLINNFGRISQKIFYNFLYCAYINLIGIGIWTTYCINFIKICRRT
jgi:hypothetical protein